MRIQESFSEKFYTILNYIIIGALCCLFVYPFLNMLSMSLSSPMEANMMSMRIIPKKLTFYAYLQVFKNEYILISFKNTFVRTILGTGVNVLLTLMAAYALSKKYLPFRNFITFIIVFTMFFNGGLIPRYLLVTGLNLNNTLWALILPEAVIAFNLIVTRNYFMSIPNEIEQAAKIDGAEELKTLFYIIVPISMPIIATISLWYAVWHWNSWFDALIYITEDKKIVLQLLLRKMIIEGSDQFMSAAGSMMLDTEFTPPMQVIKSAAVMISSIPIIMVYPFIQKYFIKGIFIGSLKG